jgi:PAS domain S-box-containing protein
LVLPDGKGIDLLHSKEEPQFPLLVMTSQGNEQAAVEAMKAGALDYVVKSAETMATMPHTAERALREWSHITERKQAQEALRKAHAELERRVEERTAQLTLANERLKQEIAEREETEEKLRESEERYRTVLEANPDPLVVYDIEGKVIYFNPAFTRVFGWALAECSGEKMDFFVPEKNWPETRMMIDKVLHGESFSGIETRRYTRQGENIPVSISGAAYRDWDGNPVGSIINLRDIREQKRLETQLLQAQKMEAVGTLAGGIAHDFNNLLQAVLGYAELLLLKKKDDSSGYRNLQAIIDAAKRGGELTQQLLTFGRKVESKLRPLNINLELERTKRLLERIIPKMIKIELLLADDLKVVMADPSQIEQILVNLAVNAKDAMPEEGKLTIRTENVILDEAYCRSLTGAKPGEYVLLAVSDTGRGMDQATLERIFEPFYTTKDPSEGTGLGLAMVYGIVENHNGVIECSSEPDTGTTFEIYLPAFEREVESGKLAENGLPRGGIETILLVDDEEFVRNPGRQSLAKFGYTVLTVSDGARALELYRKEQERIDLVILDLIMPGMSGRKCLEELIKIDPQVKVLVASGYSANESAKETIEAGAKGYIGKPYSVRQMLKVVRQVLDQN